MQRLRLSNEAKHADARSSVFVGGGRLLEYNDSTILESEV